MEISPTTAAVLVVAIVAVSIVLISIVVVLARSGKNVLKVRKSEQVKARNYIRNDHGDAYRADRHDVLDVRSDVNGRKSKPEENGG